MKVSELQNIFIEELKDLLPDWKFIKSHRHFKKVVEDVVWYLHVACINHLEDFDAVGNVAAGLVFRCTSNQPQGAALTFKKEEIS